MQTIDDLLIPKWDSILKEVQKEDGTVEDHPLPQINVDLMDVKENISRQSVDYTGLMSEYIRKKKANDIAKTISPNSLINFDAANHNHPELLIEAGNKQQPKKVVKTPLLVKRVVKVSNSTNDTLQVTALFLLHTTPGHPVLGFTASELGMQHLLLVT